MIIIDASDSRVGRIGTYVAKKLLEGEEVRIINAEKAVFVGNPKDIIAKYEHRKSLRHKGNPEKSPKWSKLPHMFMKRTIRGMLPWKSKRGREAYKRLKIYMGIPKDMGNAERIKGAELGDAVKHITVLELCKHLGYNQ